MYNNVTDIFKTTIRSPSRTFKGRLKINGKWINAGLKKMSYETSSTSEEALQLGAAVSARIELTIKKIDELFDNTEIPVEIGLKLPGGNYEYVSLGFFTAEHPKTDSNSTTFTAYDRMMKTTGVFISELIYPANAAAVMNEISSGCGVPCDTTGLDGITIETKPLGYTYREMIGYIASLAGKFASIDRNGMIVFRWYTDSDFTVNTSRLMSFEEDESDYHLDTLICNVDSSTSMTAGSGTLGITFDNPFMTQERLNAIYNEIKDFSYRGISFKTPGDIRLDPWDIVTVNYNGTEYKVPVMNIVMEYDGGLSMTVTSYGKTETESSTDFKGPSAKTSERTYAELMLAKEMIAKKVDAEWVKANTVTAEEIISVKADINTIKNNYLQTIEADIKYATIENEKVINSQIETLKANYEKVSILMFGSATGSSLTTEFSNSVVSLVGDAQIKDAMIANISASKITSGAIYTNLVKIYGDNNKRLCIEDNTIQMSDDNDIVRMQIGEDSQGRYNIIIRNSSEDVIFDASGVTEKGYHDGSIKNIAVADDANISAKKLDITSLFSEINGSSETIKSSRIYVDADGQTLDVSFKTMQTNVETAETNAVNALNAANNIQVGGRNLYYLHDIDSRQLHNVASYSVDDGEITLVANGNDLYIGEVLAAGGKWGPEFGPLMDIEGASYVTINISNPLFNKNFYNFLDSDKKALSMYTLWNISSGRITVPSGAKYLNLRVGYGAAVSGTTYKLKIKVEKGNKATDWTPAIEDTDNCIDKLTETVSTQGTQLTAVQGQISSKIWQQDITTAVNNLQIGGRNLIRYNYIVEFASKYIDKSDFVSKGKVVCSGDNINTGFRFDSASYYDASTIYTLSGYLTVTSQSCENVYLYNGKNLSFISFSIDGIDYGSPLDNIVTGANAILNDGKKHYFELKFKTPANIPADEGVSFTFIQLNKNSTTPITYEIEGFKLEKGNKATDWTPAPEDINNDILALATQYSTLEQTLSGFKVEVGATYATKDSLNSYATTASLDLYIKKDPTSGELKSAIEAIADNITLNAKGGLSISGGSSLNITSTGKFELVSNTETYLPPSYNEINVIKKAVLNETTDMLKKELYDFNSDGVIDVFDMVQAKRYMLGYETKGTFEKWKYAKKSKVTFEINPQNAQKCILLSGTDMWGTLRETYIGIDTVKTIGINALQALLKNLTVVEDESSFSSKSNYAANISSLHVGNFHTDYIETSSIKVTNVMEMSSEGTTIKIQNPSDISLTHYGRTKHPAMYTSNPITFDWNGNQLNILVDNTVVATWDWGSGTWV